MSDWRETSITPGASMAHEADVGATARATARDILRAGGIYTGLWAETAVPLPWPAILQPVVVVGDWERFTLWMGVPFQQGIVAGASSIVIPTGFAGEYLLSAHGTLYGQDTDTWGMAICKNGVPIPGLISDVASIWQVIHHTVEGLADLIQGDEIDLRFRADPGGFIGGFPQWVVYATSLHLKRA